MRGRPTRPYVIHYDPEFKLHELVGRLHDVRRPHCKLLVTIPAAVIPKSVAHLEVAFDDAAQHDDMMRRNRRGDRTVRRI